MNLYLQNIGITHVAEALRTAKPDEIIILELDEMNYMQAWCLTFNTFLVEYQSGSTATHYRYPTTTNTGETIALFMSYFLNTAYWREQS